MSNDAITRYHEARKAADDYRAKVATVPKVYQKSILALADECDQVARAIWEEELTDEDRLKADA